MTSHNMERAYAPQAERFWIETISENHEYFNRRIDASLELRFLKETNYLQVQITHLDSAGYLVKVGKMRADKKRLEGDKQLEGKQLEDKQLEDKQLEDKDKMV